MRFLIVGKPWKGGLSKYVFMALSDVFPGKVKWIPTYPNTLSEYINYRRDKETWIRQLVKKINDDDYDIAIFIKHYSFFNKIRTDRRNLLWMTDAPTIQRGEDTPFERIFITDLGYESTLIKRIDHDRYKGELALACYPKLHHPKTDAVPPYKDVCFIGNKDKLRDKGLEYIINHGVNPDVYGDYFLRSNLFWHKPTLFHPRVRNEQMELIYAKYKLSVNIHAQVVRQGTNMRTFECAAYGIPQVVDFRPGLDELFTDDAILISHNPEQMVKQIQHLLNDVNAAKSLAAKAKNRALQEHTYYHRLLYSLQDWLTPEAYKALKQTCDSLISPDI